MIFYLSEQIFYIFENSPCAKTIQLQLEIDTKGKWSIPVVYYIDGISTALCARVSDRRVFLVNIPPWGKLLQFSWGKLLHCNCHMGYKIGMKCNQITLFIKFYS